VPNYLLELEFDGRDFFGWQKQPEKRTVQGELEKVLSAIIGEKIKVYGCSRLDRFVSAFSFFANFHYSSCITPSTLRSRLNSLLPQDIYVKDIKEVKEDFHSQRQAKWKVYEYHILLGRSPIQRERVWEIEYPISISRLAAAVKFFVGKKDFHHFCDQPEEKGVCYIKRISLKKKSRSSLIIRIEGNRFLYKMVRRIIGALIDYGRGQITKTDIINAFAGLPHKPFITAPARGLFLVKVKF